MKFFAVPEDKIIEIDPCAEFKNSDPVKWARSFTTYSHMQFTFWKDCRFTCVEADITDRQPQLHKVTLPGRQFPSGRSGPELDDACAVIKVRFHSLSATHIVICESGNLWQFKNLRLEDKNVHDRNVPRYHEPRSYSNSELIDVPWVRLSIYLT